MISGDLCWGHAADDLVVGTDGKRRWAGAAPTLHSTLERTARRCPDAVAVVDDDGTSVTYGELLSLVTSIAGRLERRLSVRPGDRVALLMEAGLDYVACLYAVNRLGAAAVAVPTKCRRDEAVTLLFAADVTHVVAGPEYAAWTPSLPVEPDRVLVADASVRTDAQAPAGTCPGDPGACALMMFTSGTTSRAKAVMLSNENVVHAAGVYARLCGTTMADRCLVCLPIYYVTGLVGLVAQFLSVGGAVHIQRRFDARRALARVATERVTYLHAAPAAFSRLLELRDEFPELPSLRLLLSGSARESERVMAAYRRWLPNARFSVVYGLTETASPALLFPGDTPSSACPLATGLPVPGMDAKIVDGNGLEVPDGEPGELWLRGTNVCGGYWRRESDAHKADGWFATGDVARLDHGLVWVVDRIKDVVNRGGEKVWCSSLEEHLCRVPGIAASCVAGVPSDAYGEVPVAACVREPGSAVSEDDVRSWLSSRVARFEVPEHVVFVDELPLTPASKPDRPAVAALVTAHVARTRRTHERTALHG